jgi:hypothetical protein
MKSSIFNFKTAAAAVLMAATVITSCNKDSDEPPAPITVENQQALTQTVFADNTQGTGSVNFVTTGAWTSSITEGTPPASSASVKAATPVNWISIDPSSGDRAGSYTVSITLEPNYTGEDRAAIVAFSSGGATVTLSVTQKGTKADGTVQTNYWTSNDLTRAKLKGPVKRIAALGNYPTFAEYNQAGNLSSQGDNFSSTTYTYSNNQLVKEETSGDFREITSYSYGSHGKYIPVVPFHLPEMSGLRLNLESRITTDGGGTETNRTEYVFKGNDLLLISSYMIDGALSKDTTIITFDGNYPKSHETWDNDHTFAEFFKDLVYYPNGMFKTYIEGFKGDTYTDTRTHTFKQGGDYQLEDTYHNIRIENGETVFESNATCVYNDKYDLIKREEKREDGSSRFLDEYTYEYDAHGNWTKKTTVHKIDGAETARYSEERTIEYYE